jgi:hypothetical protein
MPVATECAALAYSAALVALFLNTNGCSPKYCSLGYEIFGWCDTEEKKCIIRTGVSNAMHAIILGQRGASLSGWESAIARSASAASKPPILRNTIQLMNISWMARNVLTYAHIVQSLLSPPLRPYHLPPLSRLSKLLANPQIAQQLRSKICHSTTSEIQRQHRHTNSPLVSYEGKTIHSTTTLSTVSDSTC